MDVVRAAQIIEQRNGTLHQVKHEVLESKSANFGNRWPLDVERTNRFHQYDVHIQFLFSSKALEQRLHVVVVLAVECDQIAIGNVIFEKFGESLLDIELPGRKRNIFFVVVGFVRRVDCELILPRVLEARILSV